MRAFNFFRGMVGARVVSIGGALNELNELLRPEGISNRHWNILPDYIRNGGDWQVMFAYVEGWESPRGGDAYNTYRENFNLANAWAMGYTARQRRGGVNRERLQPTDMEYYHTDEFMFIDVTQVMFDPNSLEPYKNMLFRHIEDGDTVLGQRIGSDHPMYNFPDVI